MRGGGSQGAPGVVSRKASPPPLPLGLGLVRGEGVSLDARRLRVSAPLPLQPLRELERWGLLVRSGRPLPAPLLSVASPRSSPHARRRGELREASEDRSRVVSSRGS